MKNFIELTPLNFDDKELINVDKIISIIPIRYKKNKTGDYESVCQILYDNRNSAQYKETYDEIKELLFNL